MFEEQLRKDIAKVIETGGHIEKRGRQHTIRFHISGVDILVWRVTKHTVEREAQTWGNEVDETQKTVFLGRPVNTVTELMTRIETIIGSATSKDDDIPF